MRHLMSQMTGEVTTLEGNNTDLMNQLLLLQADNQRLQDNVYYLSNNTDMLQEVLNNATNHGNKHILILIHFRQGIHATSSH